jgi:hypothetical protein
MVLAKPYTGSLGKRLDGVKRKFEWYRKRQNRPFGSPARAQGLARARTRASVCRVNECTCLMRGTNVKFLNLSERSRNLSARPVFHKQLQQGVPVGAKPNSTDTAPGFRRN